MAAPTMDDKEELLLSCRYGDLEDIGRFVKQFGQEIVSDVRDDNENTVLHMTAGNGHEGGQILPKVMDYELKIISTISARSVIDVLDYLLSIVPPSLLSAQNKSGSTPLHWAALNSHLSVVQKLVNFPGGPGANLIDIKNTAGRSPLAEAEMAGWDDGAKWLVEVMKLEPEQGRDGGIETEGDEHGVEKDIQVEIEDADGQIAKMTIHGSGTSSQLEP